MKISCAQIQVKQADPEKNLETAKRYIAMAKETGSDILLLPEMWTTGCHFEKNLSLIGKTEKILEKVQELAHRFKIYLFGSMLFFNEEKKPTNSGFLISPEGQCIARYDKVHLFSFVGENKYVAPGNSLTAHHFPWGDAGLAICYDLRFPELFRSYALQGAKVIFCPAAFPHPRLPHWEILIKARAIENQLYMVTCNQVGEETTDRGTVRYFGNSMIVDPWGETLARGDETEMLLTASLNIGYVDEVRSKMAVLKDRRPAVYNTIRKK